MSEPMNRAARMAVWAGCLGLSIGLGAGRSLAQDSKPSTPPPAEATKPADPPPGTGVDPQAAKEQAEASEKAARGIMQAAMEDAAAKSAPTPRPVPNLPVVETKTLPSGVVIEDLKIGEGYEVKPGGAVVAYYHGTLKADPTKVFDSAFDRGEPIGFSLNQVVAGWQEGVPGMKLGGIRRLTIPSKLGYGERGAGSDIPPNADLVFVIELVDALQVEDVVVGTGEAVGQASVAVCAHTMKDKDGKVITEADAKHPYIWIPGEHQGVMFGLPGMKVGGKRKLKIPAQFNVSPPQAQSKLPQNVPCELEIELLHLRNLQ